MKHLRPHQIRYRRLKAAGICVRCKKTEAEPSLTLCADCRASNAASGKARADRAKVSGHCRCGAKAETGSKCSPCAEKNRGQSKKWRDAHRSGGRCSGCGDEVVEGASCPKCRKAYKRHRRKHYEKRRRDSRCVKCGCPVDDLAECARCRQKQADRRGRVKLEVFTHYGLVCGCCNEAELTFLTIDHINGRGNEHRRQLAEEAGGVGGHRQFSGERFYRWLIKNKFPPGFQTLCWNCNWGKQLNGGVCPHQADP